MNIFNKFLKEETGVGIIEYIILFSLLGTIVFTTTPIIREQVGLIYEEQVQSTNKLNGMIDTLPTRRIDLDGTPQEIRPPSGSITNPEINNPTPDPPPVVEGPNTQLVTEYVTNTTGQFDPEIEYSENGYFGMIQLVPGAVTTRVEEVRKQILTKDFSKIVTKSTIEEFDSLLSINHTDPEGYTGTLTPTGEIQEVLVGNAGTTGFVFKESGPITYSEETYQTSPAFLDTLFPSGYNYNELLSGSEEGGDAVYSGYTGALFKEGPLVSTYIGQVLVPDSRNAKEYRDFTKELDVSASIKSQNSLHVFPFLYGESPINPHTYDAKEYYRNDTHEGILDYVSKESVFLETKTDTMNIDIRPTYSYEPLSPTYNYDVDGFKGTLNAVGGAYVDSGEYLAADSKTVTGQLSSNYNVAGYRGTLILETGGTYGGTVSRPATDTRIYAINYVGTASRTYDYYQYYAIYKGNSFLIQDRNPSPAPATINFTDVDGYTGILDKSTIYERTTMSDFRKTSTSKNITNHKVYTPGDFTSNVNTQTYPGTYSYLDADRFKGTLNYSSKNTEFAYTQLQNQRNQTYIRTSSNEITPTTYYYNNGGFEGTLNATTESYLSSGYYTPSDTIFVTNQPSSFYNSGGYVGSLSSYETGGSYTPSDSKWVYTTKTGSNWNNYKCVSNSWTLDSQGHTDIQGSEYTYDSGGYSGTYSVDNVDYAVSSSGSQKSGSCSPNGATATYTQYNTVYLSAYVTKPASDNRTYRYEGNVTKPAVDTRIYAREYGGMVGQPVDYYKHFALYSGSTSKTDYFATYNYNTFYQGVIKKDVLRDNFRYDQIYSGTMMKKVFDFNYEYQQEFTGTLFKEINDDVIEYTQKYEGIVEEIQ